MCMLDYLSVSSLWLLPPCMVCDQAFACLAKTEVGTHIFSVILFLEKIKELWDHLAVCLCIHLCLFISLCVRPWGHLAVSMYLPNFLVFYAVRVVLEESGLLVLPRTSCIYYEMTFAPVCLCACPPLIFEVYEIALLSVCSPPPPLQFFCFLFSMSYQRKLGDYFFPELLVSVFEHPLCRILSDWLMDC
jgi:hypothetical protein